ncbi:hypothetical protein [Thalassotalea fusca]
MNKKSWMSPEMVIGLSALVVSLVAVIVGVYSAYTDRTYARASVWPRIELNFHLSNNDDGSAFSINMSNSGIGPAIVKSVQFELNGKHLKTWEELIAVTKLKRESINVSTNSISQIVLPADKKIIALEIRNGSSKMSGEVMEILHPINISVCYCSVYEECWLKERKSPPKPIEQCALNTEQDFLQ